MVVRSFVRVIAVCLVCAGCSKNASEGIPKEIAETSGKQDEGTRDVGTRPSGATSTQKTTGMAGVEKDVLGAAKGTAKGVLAAALATYPESNYSHSKWKMLTGFKSAGDLAIDSAFDLAGVTAAQSVATIGMAGVEKNVLAATKATAKSVLTMALETYPAGNYSSAKWSTMVGFKSAADIAIDAATDPAGVTSAQKIATTGMAGVDRDALVAAKEVAKGVLATALATYPEANTSPANWKVLTGFKSAGDSAIDGATDLAAVSSAQNTATTGMAGVEKDALIAAKVTAKGVLAKALSTYVGGNYSAGNWATLTGFKSTGDSTIDAATDLAVVTLAQNNATISMSVVEKDALSGAQIAAKGILTTALATYSESNYSPANWAVLTGFKSAGEMAIGAATDLAAVILAQSTATTGMVEVEKDVLVAAKATAKGTLAKALATYVGSNYSPANWRTLTGYKSTGDTAIDAAMDLADVTTPQNAATTGMALVVKDALAAAKVAAKGILAAALSNYTEGNYSPANWAKLTGFKTAADTAIDEATDLTGVNAALNSGLGGVGK